LSAAVAADDARTPERAPRSAQSSGALTSFDLDFPGGTPGELVAAIRKASRIPLNAKFLAVPVSTAFKPKHLHHGAWNAPSARLTLLPIPASMKAEPMRRVHE
jgi:hypothetical protein